MQVMVGGCDATKKLQYEGELAKMLLAAGFEGEALTGGGGKASGGGGSGGVRVLPGSCQTGEGKRAPGSLFYFANVLDNRVARVIGFTVRACVR